MDWNKSDDSKLELQLKKLRFRWFLFKNLLMLVTVLLVANGILFLIRYFE